MKKPTLFFREWALVFTIFGFLFSFILSNFLQQKNLPSSQEEIHIAQPLEIEVLVEGAIELPGKYIFPKGILLSEALKAAKPLIDADFAAIDVNKKIYRSKKIFIPFCNKVTVYVHGSVQEEGWLNLESDSKLCDLLPIIRLEEDADTSVLSKKRKLKQGEKVFIPKRN